MTNKNFLAIPTMLVFFVVTGAGTNVEAAPDGFITSAPSYISVTDPSTDSAIPIITSGDSLSNGYTFANIPDGLGVSEKKGRFVNIFVSHELNNGTNHGGFAKVTKLQLDKNTNKVEYGGFVIDGSAEYERFCSSSLSEGNGFDQPIYFANEEVNDGLVVAVNANSNAYYELPWLGKMAHENTVQVPLFHETTGKIVLMILEDGEATESELYMYVADTDDELFAGNGQLYVLKAANSPAYNTWDDIYYGAKTIGQFVPLSWDHATQDENALDAAAESAGAFQFIRIEDGASDKRKDHGDVFYFADTGNDKDETGAAIPAGTNGQSWERGRIYKMKFTDPQDPTKVVFSVIADGNDPLAPGFGLMSNPDNLDTSKKSLMIQEDRIGVTRTSLTTPYDITKNAKIIRMDLDTGSLETVAYVNQITSPAAKHGDWESSGIVDASRAFGDGRWLVTVQAHADSERGQLLLLDIDGS